MQINFRTIPKFDPAVFPEEPAQETALSEPKFNPKPIFIVLILTGLVLFAVFVPKGRTQKQYFEELSARKEAGENLPSGEQADFCELLFLLRDSVSTECVGVLDGINWDNPPKSPEKLGGEWEEITHPDAPDKHRQFRHKKYGIEISFDKGNEKASSKAYKSKDHWHRFNPNSKSKKDLYLDKNGHPVNQGHKDSHIEVRK